MSRINLAQINLQDAPPFPRMRHWNDSDKYQNPDAPIDAQDIIICIFTEIEITNVLLYEILKEMKKLNLPSEMPTKTR